MKILMLHGSRQSGELFRAKTRGLEKCIQKVLGPLQPGGPELVYPTAPFPLATASGTVRDRHGTWTWFQSESMDGVYPGLDASLVSIASLLAESGPFGGIIGFSQGAALAAMVASLLEENRSDAFIPSGIGGISYPDCFASLTHPPLKFVVSFSGFVASHPDYRAFYTPAIRTPMLHALGSMDTVVEEEWSMKLVESCQKDDASQPTVLRHSGGHIVPAGKRELNMVVHFIKMHTS